MIRLEGGKYVAYCDGECGASINTGLRSFQQAVNYMTREADWQNRKIGKDSWRNYCPNCAEHPNPQQENAGIYIGRRFTMEDD